MQEMQMFESPEFGRVRTLVENGEILFCGSDVAKMLCIIFHPAFYSVIP